VRKIEQTHILLFVLLFNNKHFLSYHTMGNGNSSTIERQERDISSYMAKHQREVQDLKSKGYNDLQIKGKMRQIYWNNDSPLTNTSYVVSSGQYSLFKGFNEQCRRH
ncbi:hypothetical protein YASMINEVIRUS_1099, partial [Yasminevirus sp. GU-2018]